MSQKDQSYKEAIQKTMLYSSIFKYPLTYYQLLSYLIIESQEKINIRAFQYELAKLIKKQYIKVEDEMCYLPGVKYVEWKKRKKMSKTLIRRNKYVFRILESIPWVKFIGITGSVAAYNADMDADIDIFVITQLNRVWITRGFFTIILKIILGNYVFKGIDPNIFVDETSLEWPKEKQNLYTANEIVRMHPVVNKNNMYFRFMEKNLWVKDYLGNFRINTNKIEKEPHHEYQGLKFLNSLDNIAMFLQVNYMKKRKTKEVTKKHFIHFNKKDSTDPILDKYNEKVKI